MKIKLESQGRIAIPHQMLKKMGLKEGDSFQINHTDDGLLLTPKKSLSLDDTNSVLVFENQIGASRFLTMK